MTTLMPLNIGSVRPRTSGSAFDLPMILARGGDTLGRSLKKQALCLISLQTRLEEYPLALLLRNDEDRFMRVGVFVRPMLDGFEFCRRGEWQVVKIPRDSIVKVEVRS